MVNHGINAYKSSNGAVSVQKTAVSIPFFIGAWPCHTAKGYTGKPQYVTSYPEAKKLGGYSEQWRTENRKPKWSLCQAMYAHFVLNAMAPAIFYNVFDPKKHKTEAETLDFRAENHIVKLPYETLDNESLTVTVYDVSEPLVKGTDYDSYYTEGNFCIELLEDGAGYNAETVTVTFESASTDAITAEDIELAVEAVEMCRSVTGVIPDLLCAPGWSSNPAVAAVMAAKAPNINGLFKAKAVVDLDCSAEGADEYSKVLETKNKNGYTSEDMIVCWPMVKKDGHLFDLSAVLCGVMARVDSGNGDCPYESPSNKEVGISGAVNAEGEEITLTSPQADIVSITDGVVTVINFNGWVVWGNYVGCYPKTADVSKMYICTNRMQDWICNTFINTYWQYIDKPLTPILRDAIVNSFNSWLNGLTAEGKLYGGEIEYKAEYNSAGDLVNGKITLNTSAASPVPLQRVDMSIEYSVDMLEAAMNG